MTYHSIVFSDQTHSNAVALASAIPINQKSLDNSLVSNKNQNCIKFALEPYDTALVSEDVIP